jgi:hypothetical protein
MFNKINEAIIIQYLKTKKADVAPHIKSGSLLDHLLRVKGKLESWEVPHYVVEAGLCHSVYSTEIYTKKLIQESEKSDLEVLLSKETHPLINHFSRLKRDTLSYDKESDCGYYIDRYKNNKIEISKDELVGLVHIMIANELDHLTVHNFNAIETRLKMYQQFFSLLTEKAKKEVLSIVKQVHKNPQKEYLTYVGHASIWLQSDTLSLIADPWFFSSTFQRPVIQGFKPNQKTIDFAIPKPENDISEIRPDVIVISHFHTHHSPFAEIEYFATVKKIHIICPPLRSQDVLLIEKRLSSDIYNNITFTFVDKDVTIETSGATIFAFTHTVPGHIGFHIHTKTLSIVHLSDAVANKNLTTTSLDPSWEKLYNLHNIDHLFISAANQSQLRITDS